MRSGGSGRTFPASTARVRGQRSSDRARSPEKSNPTIGRRFRCVRVRTARTPGAARVRIGRPRGGGPGGRRELRNAGKSCQFRDGNRHKKRDRTRYLMSKQSESNSRSAQMDSQHCRQWRQLPETHATGCTAKQVLSPFFARSSNRQAEIREKLPAFQTRITSQRQTDEFVVNDNAATMATALSVTHTHSDSVPIEILA